MSVRSARVYAHPAVPADAPPINGLLSPGDTIVPCRPFATHLVGVVRHPVHDRPSLARGPAAGSARGDEGGGPGGEHCGGFLLGGPSVCDFVVILPRGEKYGGGKWLPAKGNPECVV